MKDLENEYRQAPVSPYGMYGFGAGPQGGMTGQFGGMQGMQPTAGALPFFPPQPSGTFIPGTPATPGIASQVPGMLPLEESFIENILRLNKGKVGTFYFTYENNNQWNAKVYRGVVEAAGRDHIIISDPQSGRRYLLLMVNLDWVEFDGELNYEYPYAGTTPRPRPRPQR